MNKDTRISPVISTNRHGYQRTTIQARKTMYPLNNRIDKASHDHLMAIKAYYDDITGMNVRPSVIIRRSIAVLANYIRTAAAATEQNAIVNASHMEDC